MTPLWLITPTHPQDYTMHLIYLTHNRAHAKEYKIINSHPRVGLIDNAHTLRLHSLSHKSKDINMENIGVQHL